MQGIGLVDCFYGNLGMMSRVCVVGLGAIGGTVAAALSLSASVAVSGLARGRSLAAIERNGLVVRGSSGEHNLRFDVADDARRFGEQDVVFIATKGQALPELAPLLTPLIGASTIIVPLLNGVPWWFFAHSAGPLKGFRPHSVDPDGIVSCSLPPDQVVGAVVHMSATSPAPGIVIRGLGNAVALGDPGGRNPGAAQHVCDLLAAGGLDAEIRSDIHHAVWFKLWGNVSFNPVSALTRATTDDIATDADTRELCSTMMREAAAVSEGFGLCIDASVASRIAMAGKLGRFKTSMLQDVEAGRRLEIAPLLGAVAEIATALKIPVPFTRAVLGLTRLLDLSLA
jgi:2-dehydropantoate 2-reductase